MGYRIRLGKIAKTEKLKYDGKAISEVEAMFDLGSDTPYRPKEHTELYEIGKHVSFSEHTSPFYSFCMYDEMEAEFEILTKAGLAAIIEFYRDETQKFFDSMLDSGAGSNEVIGYLRSRAHTWSHNKLGVLPYWLDEEKTDGEIVRSWHIDYSIFNLVYIYRTFDWENDYLIYSGW